MPDLRTPLTDTLESLHARGFRIVEIEQSQPPEDTGVVDGWHTFKPGDRVKIVVELVHED